MTQHPLVNTVQPLLAALGATLVAADEMTRSDVPLVWEGKVVAEIGRAHV